MAVREIPERFAASDAAGSHRAPEWWSSFGDPVLDEVLDSVVTANLDLAEAVARVAEVRAQARIVGAARLPSIAVNASASESRAPSNAGFGDQFAQLLSELLGLDPDSTQTGPPGEDGEDEDRGRIETRTFSASLDVAYEVDLWGRIGNDVAAAARELRASEADLHAVRLAVLSEAITAYFQVDDLRRRLSLVGQTVEVLSERERLTTDRYDRGLVTSFELYQVRQDLRNTEASLPQLQAGLAEAESRLAVLLGRYSSALGALLPDSLEPVLVTDPVPAGIPSDLLVQRPDVRAAAERFEAARLRVGARKAELLPRVTLSGSVGLQSRDASGLFDIGQWTSNLVAGLTAPIFQGGRLRGNVDAAEARYAQQVAVFGRTVLTAIEEVETALVRYREERRRYAFLQSQLQEARASVNLLSSRYASGVAGYADYLDAVRTQLNVQSNLSVAGQELALALLGVHRALGGGWVAEETPVEGAGEPR